MRLHLAFSFGALLLGASTLFAAANSNCCRPINSFEQGHELRQCQMAAAYNAPARIDVRGSLGVYTTLSYLYWQPSEDNLELGIVNSSATNDLPINGSVANLPFQYKSGAKVELGFFPPLDNWDLDILFTWLSGHIPAQASSVGAGGLLPFWGHPDNIPDDVLSGKSRWRLRLSVLDFVLGRSCYVGTNLTFHPYFGLRAAWINQKYNLQYSLASLSYGSRDTISSVGFGSEAGLDMSWLLGYGIRIIGEIETDLLLTRYNLRIKEENSAAPAGPLAVNLSQRHLYCLRPHLDTEVGLGWGTYFCNHNYHLDLSATYGFQIFWDQNMFRNFTSATAVGKSSVANGNLYIQGLTANLRFDF